MISQPSFEQKNWNNLSFQVPSIAIRRDNSAFAAAFTGTYRTELDCFSNGCEILRQDTNATYLAEYDVLTGMQTSVSMIRIPDMLDVKSRGMVYLDDDTLIVALQS